MKVLISAGGTGPDSVAAQIAQVQAAMEELEGAIAHEKDIY